MNVDRTLNGLLKLAIAVAVIGGGALAVIGVLDRLATGERAAERRALLQLNAELNASAVAPGSILACLDGDVGETVENACEKSIFATPQSAASAVSYIAARLALLGDVQALSQAEPAILEAFAAPRRAVELDRFGLAAQVLSTRYGCTAEQCAAFSWLRDTAALKGNLRAQAFNSYVAHYAAAWNKAEPEKSTPVASLPPPEPPLISGVPSGRPLSSKYDFPSAASIPPVSIMNAEPPPPKTSPDVQAGQPKADPKAEPKAEGDAAIPVPPKRPQAQAVQPPAR
jgi:hypothetical protein